MKELQNKNEYLVKAKYNFLNPYDKFYYQIKHDDLFDERDWGNTLAMSQNDLNSYIASIMNSDKLPSKEILQEKYMWNDLDTNTRMLVMSNELYGDKDGERKTYNLVTGYDKHGNEISESFEFNDYEYNDFILTQNAQHLKEQRILEERQAAKDRQSTFTKVMNSVGAGVGEFALGFLGAFEDIFNLADAVILGVTDSISNNTNYFQNVVNRLGDDSIFGLEETIDLTYESLLEWEEDNTYFMNVDGSRTTAGSIAGTVCYSLGNMTAALVTGGVTGALGGSSTVVSIVSNATFYGSSFSSRIEEKAENAKYKDVSAELIITEAALATTLDFVVEKGLGKIFGETSSDILRNTGLTSIGKRGVKSFILDSLQEGSEEFLQEFTSWLSSAAASLVDENYQTDLTLNQLLDAGAVGFISSMFTGGFAAAKQAINVHNFSKALVQNDLNYAALADNISSKETKAQRSYRKGLYEVVAAKQVIDNAYTGEKHKVLNKSLYTDNIGLTGMIKTYESMVKDLDLTTKSGQKLFKTLTQEMYAGYRVITDLYGKIGEERAAQAEKLLQTLSKGNATIEDAKVYGDTLVKSISTIGIEYDIDLSKKTAAADKIAKLRKVDTTQSKEKENIEPEVISVFNDGVEVGDTDTLNDEAKEHVKVLHEVYDHDFNLWDNWQIVEQDGEIFANLDAIKKLMPSQLMKSAASNTIVTGVRSALAKNILPDLVAKYKEVSKDKSKVVNAIEIRAVYALLFDRNFYRYMLNRSDKNFVNVLKVLDDVVNNAANDNDNKYMVQQYYNVRKQIRSHIGPTLALYFCNNPNATLENVTIFSDEQLRFIREHRFNNDMAGTVIAIDKKNPQYNNYVVAILNRIRSMDVDAQTKLRLSGAIDQRNKTISAKNLPTVSYVVKSAIDEIDRYYDGIYFGKYNDAYYLKDTDPASARFNAFLQHKSYTVSSIISGTAKVDDATTAQILAERGAVTFSDKLVYYKEQFDLFTNYEYSFEINNGKVIVIENIHKPDADTVGSMAETSTDVSRDEFLSRSYLNPNETSVSIVSLLSDYIKVDEIDLLYANVNDVVTYPEKYLKQTVIDDIRDMYGIVNNISVRAYLSDALIDASDGKYGLAMSEHGEIVAAEFATPTDIFKSELIDLADKGSIVNEYFYKDAKYKVGDVAENDIVLDHDVTIKSMNNLLVPKGEVLVKKGSTLTVKDISTLRLVGLLPDKVGTVEYSISEFVKNDMLPGSLKNITVVFEETNDLALKGSYNTTGNTIHIYVRSNSKNYDLLSTLMHEFQHACQDYNNMAPGTTTDIVITNDMVKDIKKHVPDIFGNNLSDKDAARAYLYKTAFGEQVSRGKFYDYIQVYPTLFIRGKILTSWGAKYDFNVSNKYSKDVSLEVKSDAKSDVPEEFKTGDLESRYNFSIAYKATVEKALALRDEYKSIGRKLYKKDLKGYKLPSSTIQAIVDGTYTKQGDKYWEYSGKTITQYNRHSRGKMRKDYKKSQKPSGSRYVSKKNAMGTNLMYWYDIRPDDVAQMAPELQHFVINASDLSKLPRVISDAIKNATLTTRTIYNYIRDTFIEGEDINAYTFDKLKQSFFSKTPFNSFAEVKSFVDKGIVDRAYAIKAMLLGSSSNGQDLSKYVYKRLSWPISEYHTNFNKLVKRKSTDGSTDSEIYSRTLENYNTIFVPDVNANGKAVYRLYEGSINLELANADVLLGLLQYFDGTIDSLSYIAGNAKTAVVGEATCELRGLSVPFTYRSKRDVTGHKEGTGSLESRLYDKHGELIDEDIAGVLKDATEYFERVDDVENLILSSLTTAMSDYNWDKKKVYQLYLSVKNMNETELRNLYIKLQMLNYTGMSIDDIMDNDVEIDMASFYEQLNNADEDTVKISVIHNDNRRVKNRIRSNVNDPKYGLSSLLSKKLYSKLPTEIRQYINPITFKLKIEAVNKLSVDKLNELNEQIKQIKNDIGKGYYSRLKTSQKIDELRERIKALTDRNKKLREKYKESKQSRPTKEYGYNVNITEDIAIKSDKQVPEVLKKILSTTFYTNRQSTTKFTRIADETLMAVSMREFFESNAENISKLTVDDVETILDYFETAVISNKDYVPYDTFRLYLIGHFIEQHNDRQWTLSYETLERLKAMMGGIVQNSARVLGSWKGVMKKVDPNKTMTNAMLKLFDVELTDEDLTQVNDAIANLRRANAVFQTTPEFVKERSKQLNQSIKNLERLILVKYNKKNGKSVRTALDKLITIQKAAMLSNPATALRNKISNWILGGIDIKGKHFGGINDLADILGSFLDSTSSKLLKKPSSAEDKYKSYDFAGVKVSTDIQTFIQRFILDNDILNVLHDGLTRFDSRSVKVKSTDVNDVLLDLVTKTAASRVLGQNVFGKGKFTKWLEGKTGKVFDHGTLDNIVNFVFNMSSDKDAIQKTAIRYLGKMLAVDKVNLNNGLDATVLRYIAEAYTQASYDYMHRNNAISDILNTMRRKHPKLHAGIQLVMPFMTSSWNWFVEFIQFNPATLAVNIGKLLKYEKYADKLEDLRQKGDFTAVSPRFGKMLIKRNIGKGIIGTFLMLLGIGLRSLGVLVVDEDDEKVKFKIGDLLLDFSNIYASSALLFGAQLASPTEGDWLRVVENAFNQQFEDSIFTNIMDAFRYKTSLFDVAVDLPSNIVSGFIPNVWKSFTRALNNGKIKYSKGILGNLEYIAAQLIPGVAAALPKQIDPYTGEVQTRHSIPALFDIINAISPVSFKNYKLSDVELEFIANDISLGNLSGEYKELGKLDFDTLNTFYGSLNKQTLTKFINGETKQRVKNEKGKFVDLYYNQMSSEQKKSALRSITSQNAEYAKIYTWTNSGHKYYCSSEKRRELIRLGITKNVFIGNKGYVA